MPKTAAYRTLLLTAFAAALFTGSALAQLMTSIQGTVIGKDGKPLQGVEMKFERTDIRGNYTIKTNKDGKYNYATLPQGTYNITGSIDGEPFVKQEGVKTNPAEPIVLNLDLRQLQQAQAEQPQQEVAANTLPGQPQPQGQAPEGEEARQPTEEELKKFQEEFDKAKADNEAIEARNKSLNDAFNLAMNAQQAQDWNTAIENFAKAGEIDPKQHVVFARLGEAYSERAKVQRAAAQLQDFERAATAYEKAVAILPTDANYRNNYMIALARAKKMDEAKIQADEAIKLNPATAAQVYRNLGTIYFDTSQTGPAEEMFKKSIAADPKSPDSYYRLGLVLISTVNAEGKLAQPKETEDAFKKYLELAPNGSEAENAKAMLQAAAAMK